MTKLTGHQIADEKLDGWAFLLDSLQTRIATGGFPAGLALVDAIGAAAEEMDHHPDLNLRYSFVDIRLSSHDAGGVTGRDIRLARRIGELAAEAGHTLDRSAVTRLEIALDTPDAQRLHGFYAAALGGEQHEDELVDPAGVLPTLWFQDSGSEEPRQRWHLDVWIDPSQVQSRLDATLAAGGTLVDDSNAPDFWVVADAEGNRLCFCTWRSPEVQSLG